MRVIGFGAFALVLLVLGTLPAPAGEDDTTRPALADAGARMEEILGALAKVPARVLAMDVKRRGATLRVEAGEAAALDAVRRALEGVTSLREASRDPARIVEMGAVRSVGGRLQTELQIRSREEAGSPAPEGTAAHISAEQMDAFTVEAGVRMVYASRERVTPNRKAGFETVTQRFEFQAASGRADDLTLTLLRRLCAVIRGSETVRVTEVQWRRASSEEGGTVADDRIERPRIEVSVWQPLLATPTVSPGPLAHSILRGTDAEVARAAEIAAGLDPKARLRLFREIREQARIHGLLDHTQVEGLRLEEAGLEDALKALLGPVGVSWRLSEKVEAEKKGQVEVTLAMDGVSIATVLALLTEPHEIRYLVRDGAVWFVTVEGGEPGARPEAADKALRARLESTQLTLKLEDQPFGKVLEYLVAMTGFNVYLDPRIKADVVDSPVTALHVEDLPVRQILDMLADAAGDDIVWTVKSDTVVFTRRDLLDR